MTATRTKTAAAANASKVTVPRQVGQKVQTKKRKHSDLDQVTPDSEVEPRSPTSKFVKGDPKTSTSGSDGYSGPYPQHKRPTPEECQASQSYEQSVQGGRRGDEFIQQHEMLTAFLWYCRWPEMDWQRCMGIPSVLLLGKKSLSWQRDKQLPTSRHQTKRLGKRLSWILWWVALAQLMSELCTLHASSSKSNLVH